MAQHNNVENMRTHVCALQEHKIKHENTLLCAKLQ